MSEAGSNMSGAERAAVLLMTLGESEAAEVLKHVGAKDVQRIGSVMAHLSGVSRASVTDILSGFNREIEDQTSLGVGADDYVRKVLVGALGEDKASGLIDRILVGRTSKGLESLRWMDPRAIAEAVRQEHPQIVAIVLSYIDPDQAASVLSLLPEWLRVDAVMRIATLDGIQPHALNELDDILEKKFAGAQSGKSSSLGGPKVAAGILNFLDGTSETAVMAHIKQVDETLGQRIQDLMFVFENLSTIDDRDMQTLLRDVQNDQLLLALKGCDETLREKVFKNMSQRAAEMLKDDLEAKGPVRLAEVEAAQKAILATARTLAEQSKINLGGKGEEYV